ncbi:MAG: glycoside hydrolase family 1 protein [Tissierellia bacterium]|nr:glycoside hydrolase family 1 protein [Tissierellia bacterium]
MNNKFFWGNSTSSMQTEGAQESYGKGKSVYSTYKATENTSDWMVAIDEYHRYEEDFDLMKEMGVNCYRFQISWSRIFPKGYGEINEEGIEFYKNLIKALKIRNIEPMICLYHFDMPLYLAEKYDGFSSKFVKDKFVEFGRFLVDEFNEDVKYWMTFNEHNLYATDLAFKISGSSKENNLKNLYQIMHNTLVAHGEIAKYIHRNYEDLKIGGMLAYSSVYANSSNPKDILMAEKYDDFTNKLFLDVFNMKGYPRFFNQYLRNNGIDLEIDEDELDIINSIESDFLSFSYYQSTTIKNNGNIDNFNIFNSEMIVDNKYLNRSSWNWEIDPIGLRIAMNRIYNYTKIPLFITENGIGLKEKLPENEFIEDDERIDYHREHIKNMIKAMEIDGVENIGYLAWGLIDILSSSGNMEKRYGAVYVNRGNHDLKDLRRIPKKSFKFFKKVFESNAKDGLDD